jgi:hypothetical protein
MRNLIENKIKELNEEVLSLIEQRENLLNLVQELDVRLHQVSGAISEFTKLIDKDKQL